MGTVLVPTPLPLFGHNQQGAWFYHRVLDQPNGQGVGVIVTFASQAPDCRDLQDPLAGPSLDNVPADLVGLMFESSPTVSGPGVVSLPAGPGMADFFLVVPNRQQTEGSYGLDSRSIRRPPANNPCHPQGAIDSCAP